MSDRMLVNGKQSQCYLLQSERSGLVRGTRLGVLNTDFTHKPGAGRRVYGFYTRLKNVLIAALVLHIHRDGHRRHRCRQC